MPLPASAPFRGIFATQIDALQVNDNSNLMQFRCVIYSILAAFAQLKLAFIVSSDDTDTQRICELTPERFRSHSPMSIIPLVIEIKRTKNQGTYQSFSQVDMMTLSVCSKINERYYHVPPKRPDHWQISTQLLSQLYYVGDPPISFTAKYLL